MRHNTWQYLIDWTSRMARKHGGTVRGYGRTWDWGQALCVEAYGPGWNTDPEFDRENQKPDWEPAPDKLMDAARRMEKELPTWME